MHIARLIFIAALAGCLGSASSGAENNGAPAAGIATVRLLSGEKLSGSIVNSNLTWRTPYARLAIEKSQIAEIDLAPAPGSSAYLLTMRGDHLSGLLEDDTLILRDASGSDKPLARETVATVAFARETRPAAAPAPMLLRLRNGDTLHGALAEDTLSLPGPVPVSNILALAMAPAQACTITLKDGSERRGTLPDSKLTFRLAAGPLIAIHPAALQSARVPGALDLHTSVPRTNMPGPVGMQLIWIPPGRFQMGSPPEELGRDPDEGPVTSVHILHGFWIAKHEITQAQFQHIMGGNPSSAAGTNLPVEKVTWHEAMDFCKRLNRDSETATTTPDGFAYRLPTEAEWEYACRAGTQSRFSHGDDEFGAALERFAWFSRNSGSTTHPVGAREPNPWGLHDIHGNVWEWCLDRWDGSLPGGTVTNTPAIPQGNLRAARGGSWLYDVKGCRAANRDDYSAFNRCADLGFRVVLAPITE